MLDANEDFCSNISDAKKDFFRIIHFGCEARLLFKHFGCKASSLDAKQGFVCWMQMKNFAQTFGCKTLRVQSKTFVRSILGAKQDFVQIFLMQRKGFVQTFWVQSKTFLCWMQMKTFVQTIKNFGCKCLWCKAKLLSKHFGCK